MKSITVAREKIRERKTNHVIPRNCASHYSNGPRAHHAAIYTRLRTRIYARRDACTLHHASYELNASALAHQGKLDDIALDSCSDFRILYNNKKEIYDVRKSVDEKVI